MAPAAVARNLRRVSIGSFDSLVYSWPRAAHVFGEVNLVLGAVGHHETGLLPSGTFKRNKLGYKPVKNRRDLLCCQLIPYGSHLVMGALYAFSLALNNCRDSRIQLSPSKRLFVRLLGDVFTLLH
jgi:hypothetical protein